MAKISGKWPSGSVLSEGSIIENYRAISYHDQ
jgi:hypothetical protein